jgi:glycosyltransferase involved in cell wall biosynthesis
LHVLHVFKDAFPPTFGGVEQHMWDVTRSVGPGFRSTVLTSARSPRRRVDELDGVRTVRCGEFGRLLATPVTPGWWRELRREPRPDVMHVHVPNPLAELTCLARWPPGGVVATFHADVVRSPAVARWYRRMQDAFLARVDRILVGSPVLAETSPTLAAHRDRVEVVPYGVDPEEWPAVPATVKEIRRSHGNPLVLFLGRLVPYKGVDVLIEAMRSVDASLLVVGDGPARAGLERLAGDGAGAGAGGAGGGGGGSRVRFSSRVRFVGHVSNEKRSAYYRAADVFVLPAVSRAESFGIAMLEAMAQGTPAISTEVGTGTTWVNVAGQTGLVVPPREPRALAAALRELLSDDERRKEYGAAAAARAREVFSKAAMIERLETIYAEVARS